MKAITISQPYASLIASGEKWVENRTWAANYHGPLAIHAGKGQQYLTAEQLAEYPTGCIIAVANLAACVKLSSVHEYDRHHEHKRNLIAFTNKSWHSVAAHKHTEGPWCWILEDVHAVDPILIRGSQGLWEVPPQFHGTLKTV